MSIDKKESQRKADAKRAGKRFRNWACLAYPESAVGGWKEKLSEKCVPCFISPLHDMDVWTELDEEENPEHKAGEAKKAHYHIMFMFSAVKTKEQVEEITDSLGFTKPIKVNDAQAYARYLCHLGIDGKHIYSVDDVVQLGGIDYIEMIQSSSNVVQAIAEMEDWCNENDCTSYNQLSNWCRRERPDLYRVLIHHGRHIEKTLKSAEYDRKKAMQEEQAASNLLMSEYEEFCAWKRQKREEQEAKEKQEQESQRDMPSKSVNVNEDDCSWLDELTEDSVSDEDKTVNEDWSWLEEI